jgi:preprotein translocase subunit Sss1
MRLKVSKKVWKALDTPDKDDFKAVVRCLEAGMIPLLA